jgi:hypothetical protein
MTEKLFKLGWATLFNAFPNSSQTVTKQTQEIYWKILREIPDDLWEKGFQRCLRTCKFFPTIVEIGEACLDGHLIEWSYNPHCYNEPKKLEWNKALDRVLKARAQPAVIEIKTETEVLPPPTKEEAKEILAQIEVWSAASEKREREKQKPRTSEEEIKARKLQLKDQARFLESLESQQRSGAVDQQGRDQDNVEPEWTH